MPFEFGYSTKLLFDTGARHPKPKTTQPNCLGWERRRKSIEEILRKNDWRRAREMPDDCRYMDVCASVWSRKKEPEKNGDTITRSTAACEFICSCARVCLGNQSRFIAIVIYILDAVCVLYMFVGYMLQGCSPCHTHKSKSIFIKCTHSKS